VVHSKGSSSSCGGWRRERVEDFTACVFPSLPLSTPAMTVVGMVYCNDASNR